MKNMDSVEKITGYSAVALAVLGLAFQIVNSSIAFQLESDDAKYLIENDSWRDFDYNNIQIDTPRDIAVVTGQLASISILASLAPLSLGVVYGGVKWLGNKIAPPKS